MSGRCEECGANTIWDQDVGSAICLECGTLADPTQSVLTSHFEYADTSGRESTWSNVAGTKALRGRNGWAFAGQEKEVRDRKNSIAMHDFIRSVAGRLGHAGVSLRAQGIFDQAMRVGQYRWGRKAKLTAGAAIAIALRESHKSDSILDIAYLLDESPMVISRAFGKIAHLLQFNLSVADPVAHLPKLQTHLAALLDGSGDPATTTRVLPASLTKVLSPLIQNLTVITRTATALAGLVGHTQVCAHLPTPPTACAMFMLAIEGELSSSLPNAGVLAQVLGARIGAGKDAVMQRYKQIYDLVEEWIRDVPWLDAHERTKPKGRSGQGRSKVAKRVVVARGLKDVVQFQEALWRKRMDSCGRLSIQLDEDEKGAESEDEWDNSQRSSRSSQAPSVFSDTAPPPKRAKTRHPKSVVDASQFLLNPLSSSSAPPVPTPSSSSSTTSPDLLAHLLTADAASLPDAFKRAPTRLQLLVSERGGSGEQHIPDDELFAEDELEEFIRSPEEVHAVRIAMGWDVDSEEDARRDASAATGKEAVSKGRKRRRDSSDAGQDGGDGADSTAGLNARGSKKINMDALAKLLDPETDLDAELEVAGPASLDVDIGHIGEEDEDEDGYDDDDDAGTVEGCDDRLEKMSSTRYSANEEVVEEWRPLSPGGGGGDVEDWYDF